MADLFATAAVTRRAVTIGLAGDKKGGDLCGDDEREGGEFHKIFHNVGPG